MPGGPGEREDGAGPGQASLSELVGSLQHLHQEGVDGGVTNQLKEEQVLQTLQTNGAQRWQSEEELSKPEGGQRAHFSLTNEIRDGPSE